MYIFRKNIRLFNKIQILSSAWSKTIIQTRVNSAFLSSTFLSCLLVETFSCFLQEHPHLYHLPGPLTISHLLKLFETALKSCETMYIFREKCKAIQQNTNFITCVVQKNFTHWSQQCFFIKHIYELPAGGNFLLLLARASLFVPSARTFFNFSPIKIICNSPEKP